MRKLSVALVTLIALAVLAVVYSHERTRFAGRIEANGPLKAAVLEELHDLKHQGRLDDWYCSFVTTQPKASLQQIAPDCEFARLYFHQRLWARTIRPSTVSRQQLDIAWRRSDFAHPPVLQPFGDLKSFPDFLVWAKCKISTEETAQLALVAALNSREIGPSSTIEIVACRGAGNTWKIAFKELGCAKPTLVLKVDDQDIVIRGQFDENPNQHLHWYPGNRQDRVSR